MGVEIKNEIMKKKKGKVNLSSTRLLEHHVRFYLDLFGKAILEGTKKKASHMNV
jgi:hypothetical protein